MEGKSEFTEGCKEQLSDIRIVRVIFSTPYGLSKDEEALSFFKKIFEGPLENWMIVSTAIIKIRSHNLESMQYSSKDFCSLTKPLGPVKSAAVALGASFFAFAISFPANPDSCHPEMTSLNERLQKRRCNSVLPIRRHLSSSDLRRRIKGSPQFSSRQRG